MGTFFKDDMFRFNQYNLNTNEDIFERILEDRKDGQDSDRFFLSFISLDDLAKYDFNNKESLMQFRRDCITTYDPLKSMGGCNLIPGELAKGIRYAGIKLSDPYGNIPGVFDVSNHIITYSPIFPLFYDDRDLIKFAHDTYFTSMTFEEIIMNQINNGIEYYIHTGRYNSLQDIIKHGEYIFEPISKAEMIEYAINPECGYKVLKKYLNVK